MKNLSAVTLKLFSLGICLQLLPGMMGCANKNKVEVSGSNPEILHQSQEKLTDVIVHDIFSPPVASRIYAYAHIAAYETLLHANPEYMSLSGQLNGLGELPKPDTARTYDLSFASIHAFLTVGKALIFSEDQLESYQQHLYDSVYASMPE